MKNILILSYYFPPVGGGGVQRITKLLKYIDYNRYNITVVTASGTGIDAVDRALTADIPPNVQVVHIEHELAHKIFRKSDNENKIYETSYLKRVLSSLFFFPDSRFSWIDKVLNWAANNKSMLSSFDFIIASMPPFSCGVLAAKMHEIYDIPYILDYRDGWLFNPFQMYLTPLHKLINSRMERNVLKNASGIIFVNRSLKERYNDHFADLINVKVKQAVIFNGYDEEDFAGIYNKQRKSGKGVINLALPGTIYYRGTRPDNLLKVLKNAKEIYLNKLRIHIIGKWTRSFAQKVARSGISELFEYHNYVSHHDYLRFLAEMDYNLLFLEDITNIEYLVPGRFFELLYLKNRFVLFGPEVHETGEIIKKVKGNNYYYCNSFDNIKKLLDEIITKEEISVEFSEEIKKFSREELAAQWMDFWDKI